VICREIEELDVDADAAFESAAYKRFAGLTESLEEKYGYITGDVNWGGILNIALDLRGERLLMDTFDDPDRVGRFLDEIAKVIERFTEGLGKRTGSTSISVNRNVRHLERPIYLHSECSHTMVSVDDYKKFLAKYDVDWANKYRPFGIHFCGMDAHRYAETFGRFEGLDFLDVGWGSDVAKLREHMADTFLNVRLSPVEIIEQSVDEIADTVRRLVADAGGAELTGVCCINMDEKVSDEKITAIFETVFALREEYSRK